MLKLKKIKSAEWNGNGMGTSAAEYLVVGHEHIHICKGRDGWESRDTQTGQAIVRQFGWSLKECKEMTEKAIQRTN